MSVQVPLPPGTVITQVGRNAAWSCNNCNVTVFQPNSNSWLSHLGSKRHKRNSIMAQFHEVVPEITNENASGVRVNIYKADAGDEPLPPKENGRIEIKLFDKEARGILLLRVENISIVPVVLQTAKLLASYQSTQVELLPGPIELPPGALQTLTLNYGFDFLGVYQIPLALELSRDGIQTEDGRIVQNFHVLRILYFQVTNQEAQSMEPKAPFQPSNWQFRKGLPPISRHVVKGDRLPDENRSELPDVLPLNPTIIPLSLRLLAAKGFKQRDGMSDREKLALTDLINLVEAPLTSENHYEKFRTFLYLEELQMEVNIRRYDLESVKMRSNVGGYGHLYEIKVPGLAEGRPSVLRGDWIYVKPANGMSGNTEYQGVVHKVNQETLWVGFSNQFERQRWSTHTRFQVQFSFGRLPMRMQHRAMQLSKQLKYETMLFPVKSNENLTASFRVPAKLELYDDKLANNPEQLEAVRKILEGSYKPAPYILFGPPGTGKTVTVVEAMKQIVKLNDNDHILACAASNNAADLLCRRLLKHVSEKQILRLCALSRALRAVPDNIMGCCNVYSQYGKAPTFYIPSKEQISRYKIVVCTLITAGRLVSAQFPEGHFNYVFIDEAGQASEPETLVPICGLSDPVNSDAQSPNKCRVILAGDPKQLGPVLNSMMAEQSGLAMSLLERLMTRENLYQRQQTNKQFDRRFLTKLVRNYRSHPHILCVSSKLFYDNELVPSADKQMRESLCKWEDLPKTGVPMIFHGVLGRDMREMNSPSFFNPEEVATVKYYLDRLMETKVAKPSEIGIIAPYQKQVQKLRQLLRSDVGRYGELSIGSVEEYQGAERRIIIVTTVRSNPDFLAMDKDFKLGFLTNPKRFNTAITRAKSLLIIIGNPYILERDKNWNCMLRFCVDKGAYKGVDYNPKLTDYEDDVRDDDISTKLENLHIVGDFDVVSDVRVVEQGAAVVPQE